MANTETNVDMKTLQLLRSAAASASFTDAKAVLNGKLATAADGEIVTASYLKGDEVRTLFAIQRKDVGEGTDKKYGSSFFFDSDKTAEDIQDKINEIIGEGAGTITLKELNDAIETLNGGETVNGSVSKAVKTEKDRAEAAEADINTKISDMDLDAIGGAGKFVQSVSQIDGKVNATAANLNAAAVAATPITEAETDKVPVTGNTVEGQIASIATTIKGVKDDAEAAKANAAKYKVVELTSDEIAALTGVVTANVDRAYKVVSYTGEWDSATDKTQVGETIIIYKDSALESVESSGDENTVITFKYKLADGTSKTVTVDLGKAIFESEMGNGIMVADNKIAIKLDANNENKFLTVGTNGLKLAGVQNAIDAAVADKNVAAEGDDYITATAADNKVTVTADVQGLTVTTTTGVNSTIAGVEKSLVDGKEVADKVAAFTNARISEEIAKLDATAGGTTVAANKHVAVQVVETDGKITAVNVAENDIASAAALTTEENRAKAAEDKIEASVGLAADGSFTTPVGKYYINGATSVMNAIEKLDTQAQANANAIANKLNDLDVTDASVDGQFVTAVSQTDGKIAVSRGPVAAENVSLATVSEPEGTENPKSLAATNVQAGIAELFTNILANEKVSADAIAALVNVLGEHTIDGETFEITYTGEGSDIIKNATSFSDTDEKLAAAIATLSATKVIDCGTY